MKNFTVHNPVILHFGREIIKELGSAASSLGSKALLITGKGSVKQHGIFDSVVQQLEGAGVQWVEYSGIKPNPLIDDVRKAVSLGKAETVDMVIGVGGGSVVDSAKVIAAGILSEYDAWALVKREASIEAALPVLAVLTLAATGTELNQFAVVQNPESSEKIGIGHPSLYPRHSFLDPTYTFSVNREHTAYGIVDLMAHAMENYFGLGDAPLADRYVLSILQEAHEIALPLLNEPDNYDLRARKMWVAANALNGYPGYGRLSGDFAVHALGHPISMLFDTPHAATLSIVYPAWLTWLAPRVPEKISRLGREVFGVEGVMESISALKDFYRSLGVPISLAEAGIEGNQRKDLLALWKKLQAQGYAYPLEESDYEAILDLI